MTGRGCPHGCAYCGNSFYRDLYRGQRYVRFRTVEHVMAELEDELPQGMTMDVITESASFVAASVNDVLVNIALGIAFIVFQGSNALRISATGTMMSLLSAEPLNTAQTTGSSRSARTPATCWAFSARSSPSVL